MQPDLRGTCFVCSGASLFSSLPPAQLARGLLNAQLFGARGRVLACCSRSGSFAGPALRGVAQRAHQGEGLAGGCRALLRQAWPEEAHVICSHRAAFQLLPGGRGRRDRIGLFGRDERAEEAAGGGQGAARSSARAFVWYAWLNATRAYPGSRRVCCSEGATSRPIVLSWPAAPDSFAIGRGSSSDWWLF